MRCESCREFVDLEGAKYCPGCGATIPEPPPDPLIGRVVGGRYTIKSLVAEGGMGRVYAAEQSMGERVRKVAIKVLMTTYAGRDLDMQRFARECSTVAELEHPNTIKFYDYGATDAGDPFIAMEFLAGESLSQVLRNGPMSAERVDVIVGQICGSLQEAHDRGIIHRDLKPDNVILTCPGGQPDFVKVLDFGIAKRLGGTESKLTPLGIVLGSPPYMSPEQFTLQDIDARSDIYSLAVLSFQALTGKLPFQAQDPMEWAHLHINTRPLSFDVTSAGRFVPESMRQAVLKSLSKRPGDRHASMHEFYADFTTGVTLPQGRLPSVLPIAPDLVAMANAIPKRASARPPASEEKPASQVTATEEDLEPPPRRSAPLALGEPTRESDMRRAQFPYAPGGAPTPREVETSAPSISVNELRPSAISLPIEEEAPPTEENPPRFGQAGTAVMAAAKSEPPRAPLRVRHTMPNLLPPTVRDPVELRRAAAARYGMSSYLLIGVGLVVLVGMAALSAWYFVVRSNSQAPSRPARVTRVATTQMQSATQEPVQPPASAAPRPEESAAPKREPSPCEQAVYAADQGQCDLAKRSFVNCTAESPAYAAARRTLTGLCP